MIDEKEFFREATLRICGSLNIEKAVWDCLLYVREFIPVDGMFLSHVRPDLGSIEYLAEATPEGGARSGTLVPMPRETIEWMLKEELESTMLIGRPETHPVAGVVTKYFGRPDTSVITVRLMLEGELLGAMSVIAEGNDTFTQEHADLLSSLREPFAVALSNCIRFQEVHDLKELLKDENRYLHEELRQIAGTEIIGSDFGLKGVMELARQVAPMDSPVLLMGETGTGKEMIAAAIHSLSERREGPFIKVNCGAIPPSLIDSELFGHEKGAFTGAMTQKRGRFERGHGGIIFLDEIGELPPEAQVRLLRVLQEKEIERVGGTNPVKVDIRIIAATHRNLVEMTQKEEFREDLFFRINVFPIAIPPLRTRMGDIPALVQHFLRKKSREMGLGYVPSVAVGAIEKLEVYNWPGNVRELENTVERALILSKGEPITFDEFADQTEGSSEGNAAENAEGSLLLDSAVRRHIERVLRMTQGRVAGEDGAAEILGINPSTLRHRMRKLGIFFGRSTS